MPEKGNRLVSHFGNHVTVRNKIVSERTVTRILGESAFVNLGSGYAGQAITIWVWGVAPGISLNP